MTPQNGDVIRQGDSLYVFSPNIIKMGGFQHEKETRIIQRNDKAFHWPECE